MMQIELDSKMFEVTDCNLCGADDYDIVYEARYEGLDLKHYIKEFRASGDEPLLDQLVKCRKCGLVYVTPRLKPNIIVGGYSGGSDEAFVSQANAREATFMNSLKNIERFAPRKGKILDIGTAGGSFLAAAKKRGWEVYGCEPSRWLAAWGKKNYGIDIKPGTLFDQKYKSKSFDVVTLWDVIEHVTEPDKVLNECHRILKDDGLLVINYPDWGSWIARPMGKKWVFTLAVHLYYFTPKTIRAMLDKCGFHVMKMKPHMQKLELGYLFFRMGAYSKLLSKLGGGTAKLLRLEHLKIPYWLGQTFVVSRKK